MTRIAFWNVQRLGGNTDQNRANVLNALMQYWDADLYLYCELTTLCVVPPAQNLTYRRGNPSQLCYGATDDAPNNVALTANTPNATQGYRNAGYKGGNDFTKLADRALAGAGNVDGVPIYAIHAPAGGTSGLKAMAFIASAMDQQYGGNPWLVIGDFNVEPNALGVAPVGIQVGDLIRNSGWVTHVSPGGTQTELDYVLCNFPATVRAMRPARWYQYSDHSPILVEF